MGSCRSGARLLLRRVGRQPSGPRHPGGRIGPAPRWLRFGVLSPPGAGEPVGRRELGSRFPGLNCGACTVQPTRMGSEGSIMATQKVNLHVGAWFGERQIELAFRRTGRLSSAAWAGTTSRP